MNISTRKFLQLVLLSISFAAFAEKFRLAEVRHNPLGKTKAEYMAEKIPPVNTIKLFDTKEDLEKYLDEIRQNLENTRLLENIKYEYETSNITEDEIEEITAVFTYEDSNTMIIFPIGGFDTNKGLFFEIAMKDNNFQGYGNDLKAGFSLDFGDKWDPYNFKRFTPGFNVRYDLPWYFGKTRNTWSNKIDFKWCVLDSMPRFNFQTGLTVGVPFGDFNEHEADFTFRQSVVRDLDYSQFDDEFYFTEFAEIAVPLKIGNIGLSSPVKYKPSLSFEYNWDKNGIAQDNVDLRQTPLVKTGHEILFEKIDWIGKNHFRTGYSVNLGTFLGVDLHEENGSEKQLVPSVEAKVKLYKGFDYIGFNLSASALAGKNTRYKIGENLRGATDNQNFEKGIYVDANNYALTAPVAMILCLEMPVHFFTTQLVKWFHAKGKKAEKILNFLEMEIQFNPFVDTALIQNMGTGKILSPYEGIYTAGFEFLAYPLNFKSFVFRTSIGFDLSKLVLDGKWGFDSSWRDGKIWELYAGLGLQF